LARVWAERFLGIVVHLGLRFQRGDPIPQIRKNRPDAVALKLEARSSAESGDGILRFREGVVFDWFRLRLRSVVQ
jgi:hypothetical protein